jgi:signal peptidase I
MNCLLIKPPIRKLLLVLAAVWSIRQWVLCPLLIVGASMEPTLHYWELGAANRFAYLFHPPQRGDIVVLKTGEELMVKRIIGLPGEEIGLRQGTFYIDGQPLAEPYVDVHCSLDIASSRVGPNQFVVAGDNRAETFIAVADRRRILGKLLLWRDLFASRLNSPAGHALHSDQSLLTSGCYGPEQDSRECLTPVNYLPR